MSLEQRYQTITYKCLPYLIYSLENNKFRNILSQKLQVLFDFMYSNDKIGYYDVEEEIYDMLKYPPVFSEAINNRIGRFITTYVAMNEQIVDIQSRLLKLERGV